MGVMQEKFQVRYPMKAAEPDRWVGVDSVLTTKGLNRSTAATMLNSLPPGSDIEDQEEADIRAQPFGGPWGTGTQCTDDVSATSVQKGFDRKTLRPTDDQYSSEHVDLFYDEVTVDGVTGFLERGNVLDRE